MTCASFIFTNRVMDAWNSLPNWIVTLLNTGLDALARPGDLRFSCNCCKEPEVVVKYLDMTILVMLKCELRRAWLFYTPLVWGKLLALGR